MNDILLNVIICYNLYSSNFSSCPGINNNSEDNSSSLHPQFESAVKSVNESLVFIYFVYTFQ